MRYGLRELRDDRAEAVLISEYGLADLEEVSRLGRGRRHPLLPVLLDGSLALAGPVQRPGAGVCVACAESQRLAAFGPVVPVKLPELRVGGLAAPAFHDTLSALAERLLAEPERNGDVVLALRADHGSVTRHRVTPRPEGCHVCAPPTPHTPPARVPVAVLPGALRSVNPATEGGRLREALVDSRYGPVTTVRRSGHLPLATVAAVLAGDPAGNAAGYGRTPGFAQSERVALFEAVERLGGIGAIGRSVTEAAFAGLGPERALDPVRLGLHEPECYAQPGNGLTAYAPDVPTTWADGWSYTRAAPIMVPEHVAYWGTRKPGTPRFVAETSNGCGLGNSLVEAVLHGLFEIAERDAFLMTWYAGTPLRRIAVPPDDPVLPHLSDRLEYLGYELLFFDATTDLGIPAVLSLAWRDDGAAPAAFFAAGAHPDPVAAMRSAVAELAVDVETAADRARRSPADYRRERLLHLMEHPDSVRAMNDHVALYGLPEAAGGYRFLLSGQAGTVDAAELGDDEAPRIATDLWTVLNHYVARLRRLGLELIAVDQSDRRIRDRLGLHAAKVIVPGTLPMTFGHRNRRVRGLPRLWEVPRRLGRSPTRSSDDPALPHPFP
ncbi:TOMM precursor leader peptide-binding protein [Microtetraspora malaysiensis]|uniref:TOMM precursor leader peptide-binding protein n=1 Tax=Microtetraspora malaysiensis TaxID=161358 RepID=UPI003D8D97F6